MPYVVEAVERYYPRGTLGPGDVILIPAGTPHWFGISGDRLVLLGTKLPRAPLAK